MPKIIVNICTCQRPQMLKACLESTLEQKLSADWQLEVHVVDNDTAPTLQRTVKDWATKTLIPIRYFHEPQRGIPYARNTACKQSLVNQADWIVFIDDDEIALPGWLQAFAEATTKYSADAYTGPVQYIFPADTADWLANKNDEGTPDGAKKSRASTNNVMIAKHVIASDGMRLDFDNQMALMGGSDSDFFMRLVADGGKIVFVKNAVVSEEVLPSRTTIGWRLKRQFRSSSNRIYINIKLIGLWKTFLMAVKECFRHLLEGTISLLICPLFLLFGSNVFKRRLYHALRHYAKLCGNISGLFGVHPQPYRMIDGY